jgi:hypothetical protein
LAHIDPESHHHIDNDRGAEGQETDINEPEPDAGARNTESLTQNSTYTENIEFYVIPDFLHSG